MDKDLEHLSLRVGQALLERKLTLACAESCTGGWVAEVVTAIGGSSQWFERGFVTYSNEAKNELLGVPADLIARHGAVSAEVVRTMAEGALARSRADIAVAVTGIAGPGGGSVQKPVGLVFVALARRGDGAPACHRHVFADRGRGFIRDETARAALELLLSAARGR